MSALAVLNQVETYLASGRKDLRFPAAIEVAFDAERRGHRSRALRAVILHSITYYNLFLPLDCFLLPETARCTIALHACVTLWILVSGFILKSEPSLGLRETLGISVPVAMVLQIIFVAALNGGVAAVGSYQFFSVMVVVYMNVNQRPDFRFAFAASFLIFALHSLFLVFSSLDVATTLVGIGLMASALHVTLNANWRMERDARYGFVMRLRDRLRREIAEDEADRDALTGLHNRRFFAERVDVIWSGSTPTSNASLLMIDVDLFKSYNDRYGHQAGDLCLKRVASIIQAQLRGTADILARYGGEEFVALLPDAKPMEVPRLAERIRAAVEAAAIPHDVVSGGRVTISVGFATGFTSKVVASELMSAADAALYDAKRNGRNRIWPPTGRAGAKMARLHSSQHASVG